MTRTAAAATGIDSPAARNFAWLATDKVASTLLGLLVFGLIARHYGPVGSGHYAYALTLLQTALGMSLVCGAAALLPRIARMRRGVIGALANVFVVRLLGSLAAALVVAAYAWLAIDAADRLRVALILVAAAPLLEPFAAATMYWQSRNDNRIPVAVRCTGLAARCLLVVVAVAYGAPLWVPALAWLTEAAIVAGLQTRSAVAIGTWREFAARVSAWRAAHYFHFGARFLPGIVLGQLFLRGDRLLLAQLLPAHEFGIYATAMQLVDVWLQVAHLISVSIGPAYLYAALVRHRGLLPHRRTIATLAGIGLAGFAAAALLGRPLIGAIFGPRFDASFPYLLAGMAFAVLAFVDVFVTISIAVRRQPGALAAKWGVSAAVAIASQLELFPIMNAYAGPAGLSIGLVCGWAVLLLYARSGRAAPGNAMRALR